MTIRRDLFLIFGLFTALVLFIIFGPASQPPVAEATPTTHSTGEQGAQALYEWVGRMGYTANRLEYQAFILDEQIAALVILSPSEPIEPEEAQTILDWVDQGGTLILADDTSNLLGADNALLSAIDVRIDVYTGTEAIEHAQPLQPALDQPAVGETTVQAKRYLVPERDDYVALLGSQAYPFLIGMSQGSGYLYLSSSSYPFTNAGLREPENAKLVLNVLRRVASDGIVTFDEYHHGYVRPPAPTTVVLGSPWGWAGTYTILVVALYLILSGRRFGQPIPLREEIQRRRSSEYVESMADLLQRGGKREYILRHYYQQFKRRLAKPYGISPQLEDSAFVAELARVRVIDEPALNAMLTRLQASQASEPQFVATIAEADRMLEQLHRR